MQIKPHEHLSSIFHENLGAFWEHSEPKQPPSTEEALTGSDCVSVILNSDRTVDAPGELSKLASPTPQVQPGAGISGVERKR